MDLKPKAGIQYLGEWKSKGVTVGYTTRHFPLFLKKTDDLLDLENQKKFSGLMGLKKFALLNQVHGGGIAVLDDAKKYSKDGFYHFTACDAAITNIPGMTVLVFTADCLSVFMKAGDWVGLVHAGWKGSQKKISRKTAELLLKRSGKKLTDLHAVLGPCIGADNYEVGEEFKSYFKGSSLNQKAGKLYFDVRKENERQLLELGIPSKNITHHDRCTYNESKDLHSFRRDKDQSGRLVSFIVRNS